MPNNITRTSRVPCLNQGWPCATLQLYPSHVTRRPFPNSDGDIEKRHQGLTRRIFGCSTDATPAIQIRYPSTKCEVPQFLLERNTPQVETKDRKNGRYVYAVVWKNRIVSWWCAFENLNLVESRLRFVVIEMAPTSLYQNPMPLVLTPTPLYQASILPPRLPSLDSMLSCQSQW